MISIRFPENIGAYRLRAGQIKTMHMYTGGKYAFIEGGRLFWFNQGPGGCDWSEPFYRAGMEEVRDCPREVGTEALAIDAGAESKTVE